MSAPPRDTWPASPRPDAFYGLAGEIVGAIEPHSEADPVGLLVQLVVGFGSVVGRGPHFTVEATRHGTNLYATLVGRSAKARKGTSLGHVRNLLRPVDAEWERDCIVSGLSSGEGLIQAVRDANDEDDSGVADKRLLVVQAEFASVLKVLAREGNTLSAQLRDAWDSGDLRTLTKNAPLRATDAHVSIVGHVTRDELRRYFDATEMANGFGNRILWACVRRSKELPEGGAFHRVDVAPFVRRLTEAVDFARATGEVRRDDEARELWREVYSPLSRERAGLLGAVTARAEAQVVRLALVYALLDCSPLVRIEHLQAALALWDYCDRSASYVFGASLGDPVADEILRALESSEEGLTRTQITNLLGRHKSSGRIEAALSLLEEEGLAACAKEQTGGRPSERWLASRGGARKASNASKATAREASKASKALDSSPSSLSSQPRDTSEGQQPAGAFIGREPGADDDQEEWLATASLEELHANFGDEPEPQPAMPFRGQEGGRA